MQIKQYITITMMLNLLRKPLTVTIDHLHYDVIRAKPDGSCSRPAETGPSVSKNGGKQAGKPASQKRY